MAAGTVFRVRAEDSEPVEKLLEARIYLLLFHDLLHHTRSKYRDEEDCFQNSHYCPYVMLVLVLVPVLVLVLVLVLRYEFL